MSSPPFSSRTVANSLSRSALFGGVGGDGGHAVADQRFGLVQLALAAPGDEDVGAFFDEPLRGRQPDTATAAGDHGDLSIQSSTSV